MRLTVYTKRCIVCKSNSPIVKSTGHVVAEMGRWAVIDTQPNENVKLCILAGICGQCEWPDISIQDQGCFGEWTPDMGITHAPFAKEAT